jgi:uncharacterized membrane protein (UPF0182 family)
MPESIDWPPTHAARPRRRRLFLFILAVLAVIFFGGRTSLSSYVDLLWFRSLGYGDVFWKTLSLQWGIFAAFAAATFLILYGSFLSLKRAHLADLPTGHTILIGGRPMKFPVEPVLRLFALGGSLVIAAATGAGMMAEWATLALFWYAPRPTGGVIDPIFGKHHGRSPCPRRESQPPRHVTLARTLHRVCVSVADPCDACLYRPVRALA